MASLIKKRIGRNVYWYARESQRIGGKPKIVWQKYLGRADDIVQAVQQARDGALPRARAREVRIAEFGASAALYDLAQRLDCLATIDRRVPKRGRGPSVGRYLLVAALNRAIAPRSKARIATWYQDTVLRRLLPFELAQLTSQRFWDNMDRVPLEALGEIEGELAARAVKQFDLDLRRLLFDATNFFTFIDSFNSRSTLAQRGKGKEGRAALRIVGVALLVTADAHVPLLHHTYPGNQPDAPTFSSLTEALVARYRQVAGEVEHVTLVFDKGNNSEENLAAVEDSPLHFVGSLVATHHQDLLAVSRRQFRSLAEEGLEGVEAYRKKKPVFGVKRTVVVTFNENLFVSQVQTLMREVAKRRQRFAELKRQLRAWREGRRRRGRPPTLQTTSRKVDRWLRAQHMRQLFQVEITEREGLPDVRYRFNQNAWQRLQRVRLGKTILFTDNDDWSDADIVRAYRGQSEIEAAFRCMKNPHHLALRPTHHWTDHKIQVHVFTCVLALLLTSLLERELHRRGIDLSWTRILDALADIRETVVVYPGPRLETVFSSMSDEQHQLFEALELQRYSRA